MRKILLLLGITLILAGVAVAAQASSGDAPCVQETSPANVSYTVAQVDLSYESNCIDCHINAELLAELAEDYSDAPPPPSEGSG